MNALTHYLSFRFNNMRKRLKPLGFAGTARFVLDKLTGIADCKRDVDTLYTLLNNYVDITKLHPATGTLRKMQLCNAVLLHIFDGICKKQGWTYWTDAGTLLGAVRHKGFIPWDDDIDVIMPRKDFNQITKVCPEIFAEYGIDTLETKDWQRALNIGYKLRDTSVMMDIFPADIVYSGSDDEAEGMRLLARRVEKYRKFYHAKKKHLSREELSDAGETILNAEGGKKLILIAPEFKFHLLQPTFIIPPDMVFPLSTVEFEGFTLNAPHNIHDYLTKEYGDYMLFPRSGVGQHDLCKRIERSGVDMDEVMRKMKEMEKFFLGGL